MNQESTDQVQGQESALTVDTTTLQIQSVDTSNIQLRNSKEDKITQDCNTDKIENMTSTDISKPQQSTTTETSCEAHKSLIRNLYNLLVCEKLPATDESLNLSTITTKIFSPLEISKSEVLDKEIDEFIDILEVLSEPCGCDKINSHDWVKIMTKNVQLRIEKIKIEKSRLTLLIKEDKLKDIAQKYENLKENEVVMKILFYKCYQEPRICQTKCGEENEAVTCEMSGNLSRCKGESQIFSSENENFKALKNYPSENQKFILKDLCDTFERIVVPKIQKMLSLIKSAYNSTWDTLDDSIKSTFLKSFIDFQGFYIPLQELIQNHPEHLQNLSHQQIIDIIKNGFTKVSKIEQLNIPFYLKRTFIFEHMESYVHQDPFIADYIYFTEMNQKRQFIKDHTKNYYDIREKLKITKIFILTDKLGSGKTTTLKYFARSFKEDDNKMWVSYIDAKLSLKIFEKIEKIQNWNVDGLAEFLVEILALTGIEVPIFMQKFKDNQVILLWDHIDEKFQSIFIDFAWNINQMTENQQVIATRIRYSEKLAQKFDRTAFKFIPYETFQIQKFYHRTEEFMNFFVGYWNFFQFCDKIGLGEGHYSYSCEIFINSNLLIFKLILLAFVELKMDLDYKEDLYLLFERVFKKQLLDFNPNLKEDEELDLQKFLQAHAVKTMFGDEVTKSLQIIKNYANILPPISSLDGIFTVNFDDNSVDFQHNVIVEYFIMKFIMANVINVDIKDVKVNEAKNLVTIVSMIFSQLKYKNLLNLINHAFELQYRNTAVTKEAHDNIFRIIKKAQFWPKVTKIFSPKEIKFTVHVQKSRTVLNDFDFWMRLYKEIELDKEKSEEKEKVKRTVQQTESTEGKKNAKEIKDRPTIKGVTSIKKLNQNNEISHQLNEFLEDLETDESD